MRKSKTKEEADRDLTYMEEKMRRELREKIHEFGVDCSKSFCILGYSWIDEILIYFLDLKIRLETEFIIRRRSLGHGKKKNIGMLRCSGQSGDLDKQD